MKKNTTLFIMIFLSYIGCSQSWCPTGATWHYGWQNGYTKLKYIGTGTISSVACEKIERTDVTYSSGSTVTTTPTYYYTKTTGGLVKLYNPVTATFDTLYNFNANIGDAWSFPNHDHTQCVDSRIIVQDTGHVIKSGINLKWLKIEVKQKFLSFSGFIISNDTLFERIGQKHIYLYDNTESCPNATDGQNHNFLRCYGDFQIPNLQFYNTSCENVTLIDNLIDIKSNYKIDIYPSPVNSILSIATDDVLIQKTKILITNCIGETVYSSHFDNQINVSLLQNGIYFINFMDNKNLISSKKIIKIQ